MDKIMVSHSNTVPFNKYESTVDDLPDEVLEYILSLVAPYKDLQECALVCKRWHRSVKNVVRHAQKNLNRAIADFNIRWENITPAEMEPSITKRYSHSACRYGNSMYVFGGCTSTSTTFNDLWRLDLNKRQWVRPLTMGTYPSPKACASIVSYKEALILFGGWTHPSPYPLHQAWRLFNELHTYGIISNRWTCINTTISPPAMAGHSATVQGDQMVVFGGLQKTNVLGQYGSSNDVWCLNLENLTWNMRPTSELKPHSRYGQSQISLDEKHILILGGCGGPNMVFSDVWLLSMTDPVWTWRPVEVRNTHWAAAHMWCHPACKIGQRVVIFSRNPVYTAPTLCYTSHWNPASQMQFRTSNVWVPPREDEVPADVTRRVAESNVEPRPLDRDPNVNGRRGVFSSRSYGSAQASTSSSSGEESDSDGAGPSPSNSSSPEAAPATSTSHAGSVYRSSMLSMINDPENGAAGLGMAAFRDPAPAPKAGVMKNRQRQLESLRRMEQRIRSLHGHKSSANTQASRPEAAAKGASTSAEGARPSAEQSIPGARPSGEQSFPGARPSAEHSGPGARPSAEHNCPGARPTPEHSCPGVRTYVSRNTMTMFVLDISHVLTDECYVEWLAPKTDNVINGEPEEKILYTLVAGKGELIMFGGIQKDATLITAQHLTTSITNTVSNSLHFITAPRGII